MQLLLPDHLPGHRRRLLERTAADLDRRFGDGLLGLVLSGSAGRGLDHERSDLDLIVIMTPEIVDGPDAPWHHSPELELIPLTLEHARTVAPFGTADHAYRWSWAWAPVLLDRTGGAIAEAVGRQTRLTPEETHDVLIGHHRLGVWLNLTFRALKSARAGRWHATRLDAVEALPVLLDLVFALAGLVRPYNSYLRWALEHHPLPDWPPGAVANLIDRMLDGDPEALRAGVREVERRALTFADRHDHVDIVAAFDEWRDDDYGAVLGLARHR